MANCEGFPTKNDLLVVKQSIDHITHVSKSVDSNGLPATTVTDPIDGSNVTNMTLNGLEQKYYEAISKVGFIPVNSFELGATLTLPNQALAQTSTNMYYIWTGVLPKVVPAGSTPESTGGVTMGAWFAIGDGLLRSLLANPDYGDALIGVKQRPTSLSTTQHQKNFQSLNVADYVSSGDNSTDCWQAVLDIKGSNQKPVIRFPFIYGSANIYYFLNFDPNQIQNVTFDVDYGVKLSVPNDWLASVPSALNIKFSRTTQFMFRSLKTEYTVSPGNNEAYAAKTTFLESPSFDNSIVVNINATNDTTPVKIQWPGSDTWESETYSASGADFGLFARTTGDSVVRIGVVDLLPTEEISTLLTATGTPMICAVVRHSGGYSGIMATVSQLGATIQGFQKIKGQTVSTYDISYPMLADHRSYNPLNCEWKIRVNSFKNFDILLNGFVVTSTSVSGFIIDGGFGALFDSGIPNPAVQFTNPVKIKNNGYTRNSFMAVKVFGDSVSADRVDCWPHYLKKELEFSEGVRAWSVVSKAVLGDTSAGQLAIMQSEGVSDANIVVIAIGTNDAQAQIDINQYKNNLTEMVNICQSVGRPVMLVKFGLWYPQVLSGAGVGYNTANYEFAARYRSVVSRVAAEKNVKLVELTDCEGPLTAYYVNPSLAVNLVGTGDSVVHDNIHPTTMATMLIARKIARGIMGMFTSQIGFSTSAMNSISPLNNWSINGSDRPVQLDVSVDGVATLYGVIFKNSGAYNDGTIIMQIPKNIAPRNTIEVPAAADTAGIRLVINNYGQVILYGAVGATTYISTAGISWLLK